MVVWQTIAYHEDRRQVQIHGLQDFARGIMRDYSLQGFTCVAMIL